MVLTIEQRAELIMRGWEVSVIHYIEGAGGDRRRVQYDSYLDMAVRAAPLCAQSWSIAEAAAELGVSPSRLYKAMQLADLMDELGGDPRRASLDNLAIGRETIRVTARKRRRTIERLMAEGRSVADIVLITGYSRAAVYRLRRDPLLS